MMLASLTHTCTFWGPLWPSIVLHLPLLLTNSWCPTWMIAAGCLELAVSCDLAQEGKSGPAEHNPWNQACYCTFGCQHNQRQLKPNDLGSGEGQVTESLKCVVKRLFLTYKIGCADVLSNAPPAQHLVPSWKRKNAFFILLAIFFNKFKTEV